ATCAQDLDPRLLLILLAKPLQFARRRLGRPERRRRGGAAPAPPKMAHPRRRAHKPCGVRAGRPLISRGSKCAILLGGERVASGPIWLRERAPRFRITPP